MDFKVCDSVLLIDWKRRCVKAKLASEELSDDLGHLQRQRGLKLELAEAQPFGYRAQGSPCGRLLNS